MDVAVSRNGVPIRLPLERWFHIEENHDDLAGKYSDILVTIEDPDVIIRGYEGELIAARQAGKSKSLVVVYRELAAQGGFVITAYLTSRLNQLKKRGMIWQKRQ